MLIIEPIKAFDDNYIWLMTKNNKSVVVDPGDATEIIKLIDNKTINLEGVLITHHHYDHTNGLSELIEKKNLKVFGPRNNISEINNIVGDSDQFDLIGIHFEVLEIPGHTLDHIAFYTFDNGNPVLLCGDTLFAGGCGRVFEGTFSQMFNSLQKLCTLPETTKVYCGHEYTNSNLLFALEADPNNKDLKDEYNQVINLIEQGEPTLPTTISKELKINPFLRCNSEGIKNTIKNKFNLEGNEEETFSALRKWKDNF